MKTVNLYQQQNKGVSEARNNELVTQKVVILLFLDQDDYYDNNFLEILYNEVIRTQSAIVSSGFRRINNKGKVTFNIRQYSNPYSIYRISTIWNKIFNRKFLLDNNLNFTPNSVGEDILFIVKCYRIAKNQYKTIKYIGYNWFENEISVSETVQRKLDISELLALFNELNKLDDNTKVYEYYLVSLVVFYYFHGRKGNSLSEQRKYFEITKKWFEENHPKWRLNRYIIFFPLHPDRRLNLKIKLIKFFMYSKVSWIKTNLGKIIYYEKQ